MTNSVDCEGMKIPVFKKKCCKIEQRNNICINLFSYENELTYPVYVSNQKFKIAWIYY